MSEIDIRNKSVQEVDVIRFADDDAQVVVKCRNGGAVIADSYNEVHINSIDHAEYLITALQEAINLGWLV